VRLTLNHNHANAKSTAKSLAIIRNEAYYFAPQALTKIMDVGWASYWHSGIMTRRGPFRPIS
jgi:spore cortex formation protein SpoVR/YcgB (stage V sporulation)